MSSYLCLYFHHLPRLYVLIPVRLEIVASRGLDAVNGAALAPHFRPIGRVSTVLLRQPLRVKQWLVCSRAE